MQQLQEVGVAHSECQNSSLPVSVIIAVRNEAANLSRCLGSLRNASEIYVVDSQSTDETIEIARSFGAQVVQFHYHGGWPKKRQWAMDNLPLANNWILLLDADEVLTPQLEAEIRRTIANSDCDGYSIALQMHFLGRQLRHCGATFRKLALFRWGKGHFECRIEKQDASMCDMEVHEHIVVNGKVGKLKNPLLHHNTASLFRYIAKHNEYSNWEAGVCLNGESGSSDLPASLLGNQAQRRRWLKAHFFWFPGTPVLFFLYRYFFCMGFLDGIPGLIYCVFQGIQWFHIKSKIYEMQARNHRKVITREQWQPLK
jgi:glycosyltransferase involved in cell wall biosynthesis